MDKTDLTERHYTRQQHIIINARYALSKNEIDIVLTLLTAIHKDDKDFKDYQFTIKDLEAKTERAWNSAQLKATVKGLMSKPLDLPKEKDKGWTIVNWFSMFDYENGIITCRFDKRLKPYLIDIKGRFILGDIRHLLPMKSSYSKRIYLLLKEYQKFGVRKFEVEELMAILKVPKSLLNYADFKRKVLSRAKEDINKFSDLEIDFKEKKYGRKVKWITFDIKKNDADLKTFIGIVREQYVNVALFLTKEGETVKCDEKGLLYHNNSNKTIDSQLAQKYWEFMHQNRDKFLPFQASLFDDASPTIEVNPKPAKQKAPSKTDNRLELGELIFKHMGNVCENFEDVPEADLEHEFRLFKNHQLSKLKPTTKKKWSALFENWLLQGGKVSTFMYDLNKKHEEDPESV